MKKPAALLIIICLVLFCCPLTAKENPRGNITIKSFSKAKKAFKKIYKQHPVTFYCGCSFTNRDVNHGTCGYIPKRLLTKKSKKNKRAYRIEWEHVAPAHAFGQSFKEWRVGDPKCRGKKDRKCARKNREFAFMEADLYNLVPAIAEVNGNRSNYSMAMIPGEKRSYGACDVEIESRKVEPTESIRGNIARTYMYMDWAYPGRGVISRKNRRLFKVVV